MKNIILNATEKCHTITKRNVKMKIVKISQIIIIIIIIIKHLTRQKLDMAKKRKIQERNTISPNSTVRSNHIKVRIVKTQ